MRRQDTEKVLFPGETAEVCVAMVSAYASREELKEAKMAVLPQAGSIQCQLFFGLQKVLRYKALPEGWSAKLPKLF